MKNKTIRKILTALLVALLCLFPLAACNGGGGGEQNTPPNGEQSAPADPSGGGQTDPPDSPDPPELVVDGRGNEEEWLNAPVLTTFGTATARVYRGDRALFFLFDVSDSCLLTEGDAGNDSVARSDSVEVYLDTLNDGGARPREDDFQFNLGIHGKSRTMRGTGNEWLPWNGLIDYAVVLRGTLNNGVTPNDQGYTAEVMLPYAQIGMTKTSTVGISFARVDKVGAGNVQGTDWNWYGWNWGGKLREPQNIENYVCLMPDNTLRDRDDFPKPPASVAGIVSDTKTGAPLSGVTVSAENGAVAAVTDADGRFTAADLDAETARAFTLAKYGYFDAALTVTREELRDANGGTVFKNVGMVNIETAEKTDATGTVRNVIGGAVAGATVRAAGTPLSTETAPDGTFTLNGIPIADGITLLIGKSGYADEVITIPETELSQSGVNALGDVNLSSAYNTREITFGGARGLNRFDLKTTRALNGVRFVLTTGERFAAGMPEEAILYLHAGALGTGDTAAGWADKPIGLSFRADGTVGFDKSGGKWANPALGAVKYSVTGADSSGGAVLTVEIPYALLNGMSPSGAFGLSAGTLGVNAAGLSDWDGFAWDGKFVNPENPEDYVRVDASNTFGR